MRAGELTCSHLYALWWHRWGKEVLPAAPCYLRQVRELAPGSCHKSERTILVLCQLQDTGEWVLHPPGQHSRADPVVGVPGELALGAWEQERRRHPLPMYPTAFEREGLCTLLGQNSRAGPGHMSEGGPRFEDQRAEYFCVSQPFVIPLLRSLFSSVPHF